MGLVFLIDLFWRNMFFRLRGVDTQSCLCATQDDFLHVVKEMHVSLRV